MLVVHGTADQLLPYIQAELLVGAMDKARAPYYFHTVVGGGHNPYVGLKFDASGSSFNSGGGGIGLFEDPIVEPLIKAFLHHYLLDGRKDLFYGRRRSVFMWATMRCCWMIPGPSTSRTWDYTIPKSGPEEPSLQAHPGTYLALRAGLQEANL